MPLDGNLILHCHGDGPVQWHRDERPGRTMREEQRSNRLSTITVTKVKPFHMGKYVCLEEQSGEKSTIYVFVKGR